MISVFIHSSDPDDLKNWRWAGAPPGQYLTDEHAGTYSDGKKQRFVFVRDSPSPSFIFPPDDVDVSTFIQAVVSQKETPESCAAGLKKFNSALRNKIAELSRNSIANLPPGLNPAVTPVCAFIHFGGNSYASINERLEKAWKVFGEDIPAGFLCFAITRGQPCEIYKDWQKNGNILELPCDDAGLSKVLKNCCAAWHITYPQAFETSESTQSLATNGKNTSSTEDRGHPSPGEDGSRHSSPGEEGGCKKKAPPRWASWFANLLKGIVALEMVGGFICAWVKCFRNQSLASDLGFGVLGLVFLVVPVGVLMALHDEAADASDTPEKSKKDTSSHAN
jgi:hypothetical protein